jgi:hypothetical protein
LDLKAYARAWNGCVLFNGRIIQEAADPADQSLWCEH